MSLELFTAAAPLELTAGALAERLAEVDLPAQRARWQEAGFAPVVATDLDGTVWQGDVGDALFKEGIAARRFLPPAGPPLVTLLARYDEPSTGEVHADAARLRDLFESRELQRRARAHGADERDAVLDYYRANAFCFAGHTPVQLERWSQELFERDLVAGVYGEVRALLAQLRAGGFAVLGVTATSHWLARPVAAFAGLAADEVIGMQNRVVDGVLTADFVEPLTFGLGKVKAVWQRAGGPPAVAMGDSVARTDRELLTAAALAVAVEPRGEHLALARQQDGRRWVIVRAAAESDA